MFKKSLILSFLSLFTNFFSALSQILFAKLFGSTDDFNNYLIASSIPFFISGTILVAFNYSLPPVLIKNNAKYNNSAASTTLNMTKFSLVISLAGFVASCVYFFFILNKPVNNLFILNLSLCYLYCFLQIIIGYIKCLAESLFLFLVPFIASSLYNISVVISCLVFARSIGTLSIIGGYIVGIIIGLIIIIVYLIKNKPNLFSFPSTSKNEIFEYFKSLPLILVAMLTFTVFAAIDLIWVPTLGTSKLAYINYCQKIVGNLGTLIIAGPAAVLTPYLTKQLAESTREIFLNSITKSLRLALIISTVPLIFIANYSYLITKLLLERGIFTPLDTQAVASILPFFVLAVIPTVGVVIIFRALIVTGDIMSCAKIGLVTSISYLVLSGLLKIPFGINGIGMSYLISWCVILVYSIKLLWKNDIQNIISPANIFFILKLFCICIPYQLLITQMHAYWRESGDASVFSQVLNASITFGVAVVFLIILSTLLRFEEIRFFLKKIRLIK